MLTWINAGCDVGLGLPTCQAMHPTSVLDQKRTSPIPGHVCSASKADVGHSTSVTAGVEGFSDLIPKSCV